MAEKIFKLVLVRGYTEAYYQLSEAEKAELWQRVGEKVGRVGAKKITPYYSSRWSNDRFLLFFIMEYPGVDAAIGDTAGVEEIELFRYMVSDTVLAIEGAETMP